MKRIPDTAQQAPADVSSVIDLTDWLTPAEAASEFGYSAAWLRHLRRIRAVEARVIGLCWMFNRTSLAIYRRQQDEQRQTKEKRP